MWRPRLMCGSYTTKHILRKKGNTLLSFSSKTSTVTTTNPLNNNPPHIAQGTYDVAVVGGGIVGLTTAREILQRFPDKTVTVLEKESEVACHQTGHNSGVIHAGIYYETGSTMARCCVNGAAMMYEYCNRHGLPAERSGKLICAPTAADAPVLETLLKRGTANGVEGLEIVDSEWIKKREPNVEVHSALYSPNTGIADFGAVARHCQQEIDSCGRGRVQVQFEVQDMNVVHATTDYNSDTKQFVEIRGVEPNQKGPPKVVRAKNVITCAGLQADRVANLAEGETNPKVLTFRGTYYQMKPKYMDVCKMNIYPVPSGGGIPVGVHFTPTVNERRGRQMIVGPGACMAFSREGYRFLDMNWKDIWGLVTHVGLWRFALSNFDLAITEMYRDLNKSAFLGQARKLIPSVTGVMAQIFHDNGQAAKDFILERNCLDGTTLHIRSAPTPACTASFAIADEVVDMAAEDFHWTNGRVRSHPNSTFYD